MKNYHYYCTECGNTYPITPSIMLCADCSKKQTSDEPLRGLLEINTAVKANIHDLFSFLPIEKKYFPDIPVGNTPLWPCNNIRNSLNLSNFFIKNDSSNPTGSFKDRASWLVAAFAKMSNINEVVLASTGNAGSSMAGIGSAAKLKVTIFLPRNVPKGKLVQSLQYGANVIMVDGNYDQAYDLSMEYSKGRPCINRNTAYNPMTIEGKKTAAIEIFQQIGASPDHVFLSAGDGVILSGVYKGFRDLMDLGFIKKIPTIYAVQAENSQAITRAFHNQGKFSFVSSHTIADSICVDIPRAGYLAVKNLTQNKGQCITVTDDEILCAQKELSESAGLFTEPAGACSYAGFLKVLPHIDKNEKIIILTTGIGLKDLDSAQKKIMIPGRYIKTVADIDLL